MLCVDCHRLTAMYRRTRCNLCEAKAIAPAKPRPRKARKLTGQRERLKAAIQEAIRGGAIVPGGRG